MVDGDGSRKIFVKADRQYMKMKMKLETGNSD
jgi:hypothetical protein